MQDLCELLASNPYPGRGIVVGKDVVYYWIMGRSVNSRNRVFVPTDDGIRTQAHDPALLEDPSLIIYRPVRTMGKKLVVTNGDQTDTIVDAGSFRDGCMAREFEPDAPNFTPRISAVVNADGSFEISILKHQANGRCLREFFAYEGADEGVEATKDMLPKFGKAAVHAAKAKGVADQGALAGYYMLLGLKNYFCA